MAPAWRSAVAVYILYNLIIYSCWTVAGINYTNLVSPDVILKSVVFPLAVGAVFVASVVTWLGWWRPAMREPAPGLPKWAMWIVFAAMAAFSINMMVGTNWRAIAPAHLCLLIASGILVGFNEEAINRGVLITGFRGSRFSEVWVALGSAGLFGAMHVPNALFGVPLFASVIQAVFAFMMGCGFYVLRRVSGSILVTMFLHGLWDFSTFTNQASGALAENAFYFQFGTYLIALIGLVAVLIRERNTYISAQA